MTSISKLINSQIIVILYFLTICSALAAPAIKAAKNSCDSNPDFWSQKLIRLMQLEQISRNDPSWIMGRFPRSSEYVSHSTNKERSKFILEYWNWLILEISKDGAYRPDKSSTPYQWPSGENKEVEYETRVIASRLHSEQNSRVRALAASLANVSRTKKEEWVTDWWSQHSKTFDYLNSNSKNVFVGEAVLDALEMNRREMATRIQMSLPNEFQMEENHWIRSRSELTKKYGKI